MRQSIASSVVIALWACPAIAAPPADIIELPAAKAAIHGGTARFLVLEGLGNICYWTDPADWVSWELSVPEAGEYVVEIHHSCRTGSEGATFEMTAGGRKLEGRIAVGTGSWYDHETLRLGSLSLEAGSAALELRPREKPGEAVMNLAWIRLIPAGGYAGYRERAAAEAAKAAIVHVVPNFHPASCGWLTDFSTERNYCAYSYLDHLDRVRDDPRYAFVLSEVNNLMAILAFEPERIPELKRRIAEGRAELVNAFFLEPTINLSGGEALIKMGVEGMRWQEEVMGVTPRTAWMIDVTGVHEQMAQIVSGLGLDGMVYTRDNASGKTMHWLESPDGSRTLSLSPGHYSDWGQVFNSTEPLGEDALGGLARDARGRARSTPAGAPVLVLGGGGDYALPPRRQDYPSALIDAFRRLDPPLEVRFTTLGAYLDAVLPAIRSGAIELPVVRAGARLSWTSFWIENPTVKGRYRRSEHALGAAEAAAAMSSLWSAHPYPAEPLHRAWLLMLLNMDRNTLWGAAGGMVFEHPTSWDARDRFDSVDATAGRETEAAVRSLLGEGRATGIVNPLAWDRRDPAALDLPAGTRLRGEPCQAEPDGRVLSSPALRSASIGGLELEAGPPEPPRQVPADAPIETSYYSARIDPATGALASLRLKPSGREVLAGPVRLVAEAGGDGHQTPRRAARRRLADSGGFPASVAVTEGPIATSVEIRSTFHGGSPSRQRIRFHRDSPRIDFEAEVADIPDATVVVVEFPLAEDIRETRRGIPAGFSHGAWSVPNPDLPGHADGILAAIRWSHYALAGGGGVAILDRGLPGRELEGRTPVLFLLNAQDFYLGYPCAWLSGKGPQRGSFALVAHEGEWKDAGIPRLAWELNSPPIVVPGVAAAAPRSALRASPNLVVEALRREGPDIEIRLAECLGLPGIAEVELLLPHSAARLTDLRGGRARPLAEATAYRFPVRAQEIVTLRARTESPAPAVRPLLEWDELVPPAKLAALGRRLRGVKGHPPLGPGPSDAAVPALPADAGSSATLGRTAVASNVYRRMEAHSAAKAVDGDGATRWATDETVREATLEVDLGEERRLGRAYLSEAYDRVREFALEYERDGRWEPMARGGKIGTDLELDFPPVTARRVRLRVIDGPGGPTIRELMLFAPRGRDEGKTP